VNEQIRQERNTDEKNILMCPKNIVQMLAEKKNCAKELRINKSIPSLQSGQYTLPPNTAAQQSL